MSDPTKGAPVTDPEDLTIEAVGIVTNPEPDEDADVDPDETESEDN